MVFGRHFAREAYDVVAGVWLGRREGVARRRPPPLRSGDCRPQRPVATLAKSAQHRTRRDGLDLPGQGLTAGLFTATTGVGIRALGQRLLERVCYPTGSSAATSAPAQPPPTLKPTPPGSMG